MMLPRSKILSLSSWSWALIGLVAFQLLFFCRTVCDPWTDHADFNGAVWSQAAHNFAKAGLIDTAGVPAPFHFGPLPIPAQNYYCHHPGLLALALTGLFHVFGEHEWTARLLPILCSSASVVLLWLLVKSCAGPGLATISSALFVFLPMELRWGQMVNFEPCTLPWMLAGFLGLRYWELTNRKPWKILLLAAFGMAMLTSWLGCFLVLLLCIHFLVSERKRHGQLALLLLGMFSCFAVCFLIQISLVRPDALRDLAHSFSFRLSQNVDSRTFTFSEWALRMQSSWAAHIPPIFVALALAGGVHFARKRQPEGMRWLGWFSGCVFLLNAIYVTAFRNASYIHDYASFYFVVPIATFGAVGARELGAWAAKARGDLHRGWLGGAITAALVTAAATTGLVKTQGLSSPARILDLNKSEPGNLIPQLGQVIQSEFSPEISVLSNVDRYFTPQLWYYCQRTIVNGLTRGSYWKDYISAHQHQRLGGVIWLGQPEAREILAAISPGSRRVVIVEGIPFCIWKPSRR